MNEVPLDRYFIRKDVIERRKINEQMKQIQVHMIPYIDNDSRRKILTDLESRLNPDNNISKETDVKGLERLKAMQNSE